VIDRYNTANHPEGEFEPGSNNRVLVNRLGVVDPDEMEVVELDLLVRLYDLIPEIIREDQQITVNDI
jgi:cell filamentation protein